MSATPSTADDAFSPNIFPMNTSPPPTILGRISRLWLLGSFALLSLVHAADDKLIAAVRAADEERLAATIAGDRARLDAIYSDDLHYVHSSGKNDTKASQIQGVTTGTNKYEKFEHKDRVFTPVAPGIVLMRGRVHVHMVNKQSGQKTMNDINYLAVWREEKGKWRFLAWQAAKNTDPATAPAKK
jgi:ketosteroid isomerase-like protein